MQRDIVNTNISKQISHYLQQKYIPFHSPAHAGSLIAEDLSELSGLDELQYPSSVILESQKLIAELFGAQRSLFLVNGASVGLIAALLSIKSSKTKQKILVPRNAHKAVISGIITAGFEVEWIEVKWDQDWGVYGAIDIQSIEAQLKADNYYAAIIITSPTYEGIASDISALSALGIPLIVDEAHGAHYQFSSELPETALQQGADIVIQSWHKCLGSLTQTGVLHVGTKSRVCATKIEDNLRLLQSTSPSYLLMSSISSRAEELKANGEKVFTRALELAYNARNEHLEIMPNHDPLRLMFKLKGQSLAGPLLDELFEKEKVILESCSHTGILAFINYANTTEHIEAFKLACEKISRHLDSKNEVLPKLKPEFAEQVLSPGEAFYSDYREVDLDSSIGEICQELYAPCPPGIPLFVPGQKITEANIEILKFQNKFSDKPKLKIKVVIN